MLVPSRNEGGHAWLQEHIRANYSASWHERLADGEVDAAPSCPCGPWLSPLPPPRSPPSPRARLPARPIAPGSRQVDASVHTPAFTTRWDNYWIEGILWLVRNLDIDGA